METHEVFTAIFLRLKNILCKYENNLEVKINTPDNYSLDSKRLFANTGKPISFGAVQIKKNYVSYHLMPIYACPDLLQGISIDLKKRMQGKSCFNFKKMDEEAFRELEALTRNGFETFKNKNLI